MPDSSTPKKKPRIRKSAPTVRERAEIAQSKAENPKPPKLRRGFSTAAKPLKRLRLPDSRVTRGLNRIGRAIGRVLRKLVPSYFVNSWREVRQVTWPNRRETWRLTLAVFIFAIIFGAMIYGVDKVLDMIFKKVVLK